MEPAIQRPAAAPLPSINAASPPAGSQAPGCYRYKVGRIEITVMTDGTDRSAIPDTFVAHAGKDQINAELATDFMPTGFFAGRTNRSWSPPAVA